MEEGGAEAPAAALHPPDRAWRPGDEEAQVGEAGIFAETKARCHNSGCVRGNRQGDQLFGNLHKDKVSLKPFFVLFWPFFAL